jgi:hypothetical protein
MGKLKHDSPAREWLEPELLEGEKLLWVSARQPQRLIPADVASLALGVGWMLAIIGLFAPALANSGLLFAALTLILTGIGLSFFAQPFARYWQQRNTFYGISNRRVLIRLRGLRPRILSIYPAQMKGVELRERRDGTGDLILGHDSQRSYAYGVPMDSQRAYGLFDVPHVRHVEALLHSTLHAVEVSQSPLTEPDLADYTTREAVRRLQS